MDIDFNIYSVILLFGTLQGFLYTTLFVIRGIRSERLSDVIMALLILSVSMEIVPYTLGFMNINVLWETLFFFPHDMGLLIGPLFYFYFISQTNLAFRFKKKHVLHLVPFATVTLYHLAVFSLGRNFVLAWDNFFHRPFHIGTLETVMYIFSNAFYFAVSWRYYKLFSQWTPTMFSSTETVSFSWYRNLLSAMAIGLVASWAMDFADHWWSFSFQHDWWDKVIIVVIIYYLTISGYSQKQSERLFFDSKPVQVKAPPIETEPRKINEGDDLLLLQKIIGLLQSDKIYRRSDLSLMEMARQLSTNTSRLSFAINRHFGKNFNDLINSYRVDEVKQMINAGSHENFSLLGIAFDCGFNSKATFNRVFKKQTGMTPREYVIQRSPTGDDRETISIGSSL